MSSSFFCLFLCVCVYGNVYKGRINMIDYRLIGKRLKEAREKENFTQEYVAEQVGISSVYLSKIENGRVHPTIELLNQLCIATKTELGNLFANSSSESASYQTEVIVSLFRSLSPKVKPIAVELMESLNRIDKE